MQRLPAAVIAMVLLWSPVVSLVCDQWCAPAVATAAGHACHETPASNAQLTSAGDCLDHVLSGVSSGPALRLDAVANVPVSIGTFQPPRALALVRRVAGAWPAAPPRPPLPLRI